MTMNMCILLAVLTQVMTVAGESSSAYGVVTKALHDYLPVSEIATYDCKFTSLSGPLQHASDSSVAAGHWESPILVSHSPGFSAESWQRLESNNWLNREIILS
jgi:hypothetical protein